MWRAKLLSICKELDKNLKVFITIWNSLSALLILPLQTPLENTKNNYFSG